MRIALLLVFAWLLGGCTLPWVSGPPEPILPTPAASIQSTTALPAKATATQPPAAASPSPQPTPTAGALPTASTRSSITPTALPARTATPLLQPQTPEGVVQAFLEAYPDDDETMMRCLGPALRSGLAPGATGSLLRVQGDLEGYVILSVTSQPRPAAAVVVVALQAGGEAVQRTFSLVNFGQGWKIEGISD